MMGPLRAWKYPRFAQRRTMYRCGSWLSGGVLSLYVKSTAAAPTPHVEIQLRYERDRGADSCPNEGVLRAGVAERLGYDPFVSKEGLDTILVRVHPVRAGLEGTIEQVDGSGLRRARPMAIASTSNDCVELSSVLAVAIAVAVDPFHMTRAAPRTPTPITPSTVHVSHPRESPAPPLLTQERRIRHEWMIGLGPSVSTGILPSLSLGARAMAGIAWKMFEVDVEGRFDAPVKLQQSGGSVEASLVLATVAPCFRYRFALACAHASLGALRGTGLGFDRTREENTFYVSAGGRLGVEASLAERVALRISGEGQIPLRPTRLEVDGTPVWSTPAFGVSAVAMLVARFP